MCDTKYKAKIKTTDEFTRTEIKDSHVAGQQTSQNIGLVLRKRVLNFVMNKYVDDRILRGKKTFVVFFLTSLVTFQHFSPIFLSHFHGLQHKSDRDRRGACVLLIRLQGEGTTFSTYHTNDINPFVFWRHKKPTFLKSFYFFFCPFNLYSLIHGNFAVTVFFFFFFIRQH